MILLFVHEIFMFDLPKCKPVDIDGDQYQVSDTYHVGDAVPSEAHYDVYGNLFYVKYRSENDGFFYDIYVIKFKTTSAEKITGKRISFTDLFRTIILSQCKVWFFMSVYYYKIVSQKSNRGARLS